MPIKGKTQEEFTGFTKKVGVFEGKVIAINPDKEKLVEILGTDKVKDPEYLGKDREGNDQIRLDFWMQDVNDDSENPHKDKVSFFLSSSPLQTRNGDKTKYINIQGNVSFYTPDEENLPSWFAEFDHWQANSGEDYLYYFLQSWLQVKTFNDPDAEMWVKRDALLKGNVRELRSFMGTEFDNTVIVNSIIRTVIKEDEEGNDITKEYVNLFSKDFLPGYYMKYFKLHGEEIKKISSEKEDMDERDYVKSTAAFPKKVVKYAEQCAYSIKDYYSLNTLHDYKKEENEIVQDDSPVLGDSEDLY